MSCELNLVKFGYRLTVGMKRMVFLKKEIPEPPRQSLASQSVGAPFGQTIQSERFLTQDLHQRLPPGGIMSQGMLGVLRHSLHGILDDMNAIPDREG